MMLAVAGTSEPVSREVRGLLRGSAVAAVSAEDLAKGRQLRSAAAQPRRGGQQPAHPSQVY